MKTTCIVTVLESFCHCLGTALLYKPTEYDKEFDSDKKSILAFEYLKQEKENNIYNFDIQF